MNPNSPQPQVSALARNIFRVCLGLFLVSLLVFFLFFQLNRHVQSTLGKVTDVYTREAVTGRKSVGEKEFMTVTYMVKDKEYTGTTPLPGRRGFSSRPERVPVYYYSGLPSFGWFSSRSNGSLLYCSLFLIIAAGLFVLSVWELQKEKKALLVSPKKKK